MHFKLIEHIQKSISQLYFIYTKMQNIFSFTQWWLYFRNYKSFSAWTYFFPFSVIFGLLVMPWKSTLLQPNQCARKLTYQNSDNESLVEASFQAPNFGFYKKWDILLVFFHKIQNEALLNNVRLLAHLLTRSNS